MTAKKKLPEITFQSFLRFSNLRRGCLACWDFQTLQNEVLHRKMAPSVDSVKELRKLIVEKALPAAERKLAEITELAKSKGYTGDKLQPWDTTFWSKRLRESKFDLTEEELRPDFAFPRVL